MGRHGEVTVITSCSEKIVLWKFKTRPQVAGAHLVVLWKDICSGQFFVFVFLSGLFPVFFFVWTSNFLFPIRFKPETSHKPSSTLYHLNQALSLKRMLLSVFEPFSCSIWSSVIASDTYC